jgi:hypothetical protein
MGVFVEADEIPGPVLLIIWVLGNTSSFYVLSMEMRFKYGKTFNAHTRVLKRSFYTVQNCFLGCTAV